MSSTDQQPDAAQSRPLVRVERADDGPLEHVAHLVLDRPEALNAVSTAMAEAIIAATAQVAADPSVRAVVVSSSHPSVFCAGADLKERAGFTDADMMAQRPVTRAAYASVLNLPVPAIAAVTGHALGGGCEIALGCDIIVAAREARVGLPEVAVGVIPGGGGTQLLTRRIGWSRAARAIFTAAKMTAQEALELGVVDEVHDRSDVLERALELAAGIATNSPVGLRNAKKAMRLGQGVDLAAGLEIEDACWRATAFSGDRREGVAAFNDKRTPNWPGV